MKIKTYGSRFFGGQIDRIEQGFKELGHEITINLDEADLLYSNDFDQADVAAVERQIVDAKYIQNLLDIPWHLVEKDKSILDKISQRLDRADYITTISETVQSQIKQEFKYDSNVIYQPIKPVNNLGLKKDIEFLMIGRLNDPNKRASLGIQVINKFKEQIPQIRAVTVGSEDIRADGILHLGILNDEELNEVYNRTKYVLCLGKVEGLNLPIPESICAGSIPISLNDSEVSFEFNPHVFISEPAVESIYEKIQKIDYYYKEIIDSVVKPLAEIYQEKFSPKSVAARIIEAAEK